MKVYIAGPMTGIPDFNYPAFHEAEKMLLDLGLEVENPADHFDGDTSLPHHVYMREAIRSLTRCDAIYLLRGWQDSKGAELEARVADAMGIPVMLEEGVPWG